MDSTNRPQEGHIDEPTTGLFSLPIELRLEIYNLVIRPTIEDTASQLRKGQSHLRLIPHGTHHSALLATSQQIRQDCLDNNLYSRSIHIETTEDDGSTWTTLSGIQVANLPRLYFYRYLDATPKGEKHRINALPRIGGKRRVGVVSFPGMEDVGVCVFFQDLERREAVWQKGLVRLGTVSRVDS